MKRVIGKLVWKVQDETEGYGLHSVTFERVTR